MISDEVETAKLRRSIEVIGAILVRMETGDNPDGIKDVVERDFIDPAFARGFILGLNTILKCDGIAAYISGPGTLPLKNRILGIEAEFKILDALKAEAEAA